MSELLERVSKLSATITRLEKQKSEAIQEIERLTRQITTDLVDGRDPAELLIARQFKQAMAEAIPPALVEAQRQLEEAQRDIENRATQAKIDELQAKRDGLQARWDEIERIFKEQSWPQGRQTLIDEWDVLNVQIRALNNTLSGLQKGLKKDAPTDTAASTVAPASLADTLESMRQRLAEVNILITAAPSTSPFRGRSDNSPLLREKQELEQAIAEIDGGHF